jgi:hypothetical protein
MAIFFRIVALLVTLAVATVVLFPVGSGPFTATHGPASALRAAADVALVFVLLSTLLVLGTNRPESHPRQEISFAPVVIFAYATAQPLRC